MKKLLIPILLSLSFGTAIAQQNLLNGNFEDTLALTNQGTTMIMPRDWSTSGFGAGVTTDAAAGNFAVYVWNWYFYGKGILANGSSIDPANGGTPVNFRPDLLNGYFKYIPGDVNTTNDSAVVFVSLTKFNTFSNQRDTIGFGTMKFGPENTYQPFSVNIGYTSAAQPDTLLIRFLSSESGFCSTFSAGDCLFLYVDELTVSNTATGITENVSLNSFTTYPNPADQVVHVKNNTDQTQLLQIISAEGKVVYENSAMEATEMQINISHLNAGIYFVRMGNSGKPQKLVIR